MSQTVENLPAQQAEVSAPAPMMAAEWDMIRVQADHLARSKVVPKQYRGEPDDIIAAALYGRELGFGIATSLNLIDVIEGNPEINAEGKLSLIRARRHSVQGYVNEDEARLIGVRADNGDTMEVVFTYEEAQRIKVSSWSGPQNNRRKVESSLTDKDNWRNFRQDMLWARAVSRLGRRLFGDVLQGFSYDRDEIESHILEAYEPEPAAVAKPIPMVRRRPDVSEQAPIDVEATETEGTSTQAASDDTPQASTGAKSVNPASPAQHKFIEKLLGTKADLEAHDREGRHAKVGEILGRTVESLNDLTSPEASKVIDTLNRS